MTNHRINTYQCHTHCIALHAALAWSVRSLFPSWRSLPTLCFSYLLLSFKVPEVSSNSYNYQQIYTSASRQCSREPFLSTAGQTQCVGGFLASSAISNLENEDNLEFKTGPVQIIIPGIVFNCTGSISTWEYAISENCNGATKPYSCLELQVWRPIQGSSGKAQSYIRVANVLTPTNLSATNADFYQHRMNVNPPIPVQSGDIFGVFIPPTTSCPYCLQFRNSSGSGELLFSAETSLKSLQVNATTTMDYAIPLVSARVTESKKHAGISMAYLESLKFITTLL